MKYNVKYSKKSFSFSEGEIVSSQRVYDYCKTIHHQEEDFEDGDIGDRLLQFDSYIVRILPLNKIEYDMYYTDNYTVEEYSNFEGPMPPVVINENYCIEDGCHRCKAAYMRCDSSIACLVPYCKDGKFVKTKGEGIWNVVLSYLDGDIIKPDKNLNPTHSGEYLCTCLSKVPYEDKYIRYLRVMEYDEENNYWHDIGKKHAVSHNVLAWTDIDLCEFSDFSYICGGNFMVKDSE